MSTLAKLKDEAIEYASEHGLDNPKTFLAIFPAGPVNGRFLDPFIGIIQLNKVEGFLFYSSLFGREDTNPHSLQAFWVD